MRKIPVDVIFTLASTFDVLEKAATAYLGLLLAPAPAPHRDPLLTTKLIILVRAVRHARDNLEAATNSGGVPDVQFVNIVEATLANVFRELSIANTNPTQSDWTHLLKAVSADLAVNASPTPPDLATLKLVDAPADAAFEAAAVAAGAAP